MVTAIVTARRRPLVRSAGMKALDLHRFSVKRIASEERRSNQMHFINGDIAIESKVLLVDVTQYFL